MNSLATKSNLPADWQVVKLGEHIEERKEKNRDGLELPVYSVSNVHGFILSEEFFDKRVYSKSLKTYKIVEKNDFAYNPARVNVGSLALFDRDERGLVSPMYVVFKIKNLESLLPHFLFLLLKTSRYSGMIKGVAASRGSVRKILAFEDLSDFEIPLPPLPEQQKIVYVLDTIQEAIGVQEKLIEKTKELKRAMMAKLFREGTRGEKLKKTEIGEIPESWEVVPLGKECEVFSGFAFKSSEFTSEGVAVIKIGNLQNGTLVRDKKTSFYPEEKSTNERLAKYILNEGDVLIALSGATTGKTAIVPHDFSGSLLNQRVGKFNVFGNRLILQFSRYFFISNYFQRRVWENILQSAQGNVSPKQIEQIIIPLPSKAEQREIVEILQTIDQKIDVEQKKKALYEELFQAMLDKLMTAEIRVNNVSFD